MGQETICTARWNGRATEGRASLETSELRFRGGDLWLRIPLEAVVAARAADGVLEIEWSDGVAELEVGRAAERWARRITDPPSRLDKLGVKPGQRVGLSGLEDAELLAELRGRAGSVEVGALAGAYDLLFVGVERPEELARIAALRAHLTPSGGIWAISPRGRPGVRDVDVIGAGRAAGLVDVKNARFSATHTANKLVIPVAARSR
jgi:hypothetical protein